MRFIRFVKQLNSRDIHFTERVVDLALEKSTEQELAMARECVQKQIAYKDKEELGLNYKNKNSRIRAYISYYTNKLQNGELINYTEENIQADKDKIIEGVEARKTTKYFLSIGERLSKSIAGQYISSLSDHEFIELLLDENLITKEQYESLTRKYLDIEDLSSEVYLQSNWASIAKAQKKATDEIAKGK